MHIMVKKRCMRKSDACVGRETHINKLRLEKPPGLRSASGASHDEPLRAIKGKSGGRQKQKKIYIEVDRGRRQTPSPALGIESSETCGVPWVRLESVIRRISQAVRSTSQDLVNYEGSFPFGLEFVLFLIRQA